MSLSRIIRDIITIEPLDLSQLQAKLPEYSRAIIRDCANRQASRGYIERLEDGKFTMKNGVQSQHRGAKQQITISAKQPSTSMKAKGPGETVEEFLARGGKIEQAETPLPFERLTVDDIQAHRGVVGGGYQTPISPRLSGG